jgi:outer membrane lipoprotein carrier protein
MKQLFRVILLILLPVVFLSAQDNGNNLLESIQKKYKSINDLTADFSQILNGKANVTGKFQFARGNKLRLELKNSTIMSDGTTLWNYNKNQKKVVISKVSSTDPVYFSIDKFLYEYPSKSNVSSEKENNQDVLVLVPKKGTNLDFKKARIFVNRDNLVSKITIENLSGTTMDFHLSDFKLNQNLPDSKFSFSPPEGTNIIDLRK